MGAITQSSEQVIKQLEKSRGNISHAAKALDTSRRVMHKYINEHPTVKDALKDIKETSKDRGEMMLEARMATSDTLLIFYLKTQARDRGYGDMSKTEISGPNGGPLEVKNVSQLSDDERLARLAALVDAARERGVRLTSSEQPS